MSAAKIEGWPRIAGRCPSCGSTSTLFLGSGGHVTCSWIECANPAAVDEWLHTPLVEPTWQYPLVHAATLYACIDMKHDVGTFHLNGELDRATCHDCRRAYDRYWSPKADDGAAS